MTEGLAGAIDRVRARIAAAAARAGRGPDAVTLVAVTKSVDPERVARAAGLGIADVGENRVRELIDKQGALAGVPGLRWHLVGTLQRNKVPQVVGRVSLIHSVDSVRLGATVGARATTTGAVQGVLLQVNVSGEATKQGVAPAATEDVAHALAALPGIMLRGLMTIAAPGDAGGARAGFARLRDLRDKIVRPLPQATELSMGMSEDFEGAIEEGATIVRIGTAIFGRRPD